MRLNPEGYQRFLQADCFRASYAGGEANVAVSLSILGNQASFVSKLPDNELGQNAVNALRRYGVRTEHILRGGPRLGIYFVEKGASQRGGKVIYDRAGSSIACAAAGEFNWPEILRGADWFHFTGITPALSGEMARACGDALVTAKSMGITTSCDLNYRSKLWSREEAGRTMSELMPYVDVCIANEEDAADVFGIRAENTDVASGRLDSEGYVQVAKRLMERFAFKRVAITLRGSESATVNRWSGMICDGKTACFAPEYRIHLVDRVGGGDSFGAGLIHAMRKWPEEPQRIIDFAAAASCLKQTTEFDFNLSSEKEILALAAGNSSGRVQR